jgi:beta-phosphoglucomutase family hydrolase
MFIPKIKAVIWDMDGVIADTAPYHFRAWQEIFNIRGVKFTEDDFKHSFGLRNDTIIRNILGEQAAQGEIDAIAREKEETFRRVIGQNTRPLPGVLELIKALKQQGFKMAIASSTPIENIRLITGSLGIDTCFQAIITGQDVTEGKPSPQIFLFAARRLGVEPRNCIVIEDAVAGVAAAKKAGMRCLAVTNTHPRERLAEADLIVDTLRAITVNDLEKLLKTAE